MKATLTVEVDDLAELARVLSVFAGPHPAVSGSANVVWTTPLSPVSSASSPAPTPPSQPPERPRRGPAPTATRRLLQALHDQGGAINDGTGRAVTPLAEALRLGRARVTSILRDAEADGFVTRTVEGKRTKRIALTAAGRSHLGVDAPAAPSKPDLSSPRVIEVLEEADDAPLVFKTREQRQQEIRDAQADAQYPRDGKP